MRRCIIILALGASFALTTAGGTEAADVVSVPPGTPNLALMVIQPSDLVAGATLGDQAYVAPPTGFTAQFGSEYSSAATPDGVNYALVLDYVALAPDTTTATTFFSAEDAYDKSRKGRKFVTKNIIKGFGKKDHVKAKDVKFTLEQSAGVGSSSFVETISIKVKVKHITVHEVFLIFQDGTVVTSLELAGYTPIPETDASLLANSIETNINSVLGASGSTGASGVTGAT